MDSRGTDSERQLRATWTGKDLEANMREIVNQPLDVTPNVLHMTFGTYTKQEDGTYTFEGDEQKRIEFVEAFKQAMKRQKFGATPAEAWKQISAGYHPNPSGKPNRNARRRARHKLKR